MKKLLAIIIVLISLSASGQVVYTPLGAAGYQIKYLKADSGFSLPVRDTAIGRGVNKPGLVVISPKDSLPYYYNGTIWKPIYIDSAGVIKLVTGKVDSVTVSGNNVFYWQGGVSHGQLLNKLDSIHRSGDSVFTCIAGNCIFQMRADSVNISTDSLFTTSTNDSVPSTRAVKLALAGKSSYISSVSALENYTGNSNTVIVQDSLRGGIFNYVASATPDSGTVFKRYNGGYWKRQFSGALNVEWFDAKPDAATNNITPLRNAVWAASIAKAAGKVVSIWFPPDNNYYLISDSLYVPSGISVIMDNAIFAQDTTKSAITIGDSTSVSASMTYKINVSSYIQSAWHNQNNIGVRFVNANNCDINIVKVEGFTKGVQIAGINQGSVYNHIELGAISGNMIGVELFATGSTGWVNENSFYDGRFWNSSSVNTGKSRYGVVINTNDNEPPNNNNFYKPSFELYGAGASPGECVPIDIKSGTLNSFKECRNESNSDNERNIFVRTLNAASYNKIELGYGTGTLLDSSSVPTSLIVSRNNQLTQSITAEYNSGDLIKRINPYDGANWYAQDELFFGSSSNATIFQALDTTSIKVASNYINILPSGALGVRLATDIYKRYVLKRSTIKGNGGYVYFRCYDSTGAILYSTSIKYIKGAGSYAISASSNFGGSYSTGVNGSGDLYFQVDSAVSYVDVLLNGGYIKSFKIQGLDGTTVIRNLKTKVGKYATQAPTAGTWEQGTIIHNVNPSSVTGWLCTVAGTPGTWIPETETSILLNPNITDGTPPDANVVTGGYKSWYSGAATNGASGTHYGGIITFYSSGDNNLQFQYDNGHVDNNGSLFYRTKSSVGWHSWFQVATKVDLAAKADTGSTKFYTNGSIDIDTLANPGHPTLKVDSAYIDSTTRSIAATEGTYTPTITGVANYAAGTAYVCRYIRTGNTVTVYGKVTVQPTATATVTTFSLSLPINSTFTDSYDAAGTGGGIFSSVYYPYIISSAASGSVLNVSFISNQTAGQQDCQFTATYKVL